MSSTIEKNHKQQRSDSGQTTTSTPTPASATQTLKKGQDNNKNHNTGKEEQQETRRTNRRTTKVGLNDTLRSIRQLMLEGRSNSEIQNILQLEERTFYRYMAKIYEIDQALFQEQEKKTITTEIGLFRDRLLKSYLWYNAMADNENMKAEIRMEAKRNALEVARAVVKLELEGPRVIEEGQRLVKKLYQNS